MHFECIIRRVHDCPVTFMIFAMMETRKMRAVIILLFFIIFSNSSQPERFLLTKRVCVCVCIKSALWLLFFFIHVFFLFFIFRVSFLFGELLCARVYTCFEAIYSFSITFKKSSFKWCC